jgi:hypothetical protein
MKKINLTRGKVAMVDDADYDWLSEYKWHFKASAAYTKIKKKTISMHRLIMNAPEGMEVDHINHNRFDNRRENLRLCTKSQNQWNGILRKDNTSGYRGVSYVKRDKVWQAYIRIFGKGLHLGTYKTKSEAIKVRKIAEEKYFGEFNYKK